ncbi:hypothetical protein [Prochlorococcus sp. MIT 1341]|uniref:hypothetical protein n=1 Tax=Prochlorococcus sp. MIT 1341 TaxID=3096221 RepID=UPI002A74D044|nr:hypothetical protein [Prochlorococcus sp. MIT 1341]
MGELANILRANLRELAHSHSRTLRGIDAELKAARESEVLPSDQNQSDFLKALLGPGTFMQQSKETLKALGKNHGVKRYGNKPFSKLNKSDLSAALEEKGVEAPPRPIEDLNKKELVVFSKNLMDLLLKAEIKSVQKELAA